MVYFFSLFLFSRPYMPFPLSNNHLLFHFIIFVFRILTYWIDLLFALSKVKCPFLLVLSTYYATCVLRRNVRIISCSYCTSFLLDIY